MKCTYRSIGFVASALVHLVGVAALMPRLSGVAPSADAESRVAVSLAMFRPAAAPAPAEPEPPEAEPAAMPEPPVEPPPPEPEPVPIPPRPASLPEPPPAEPETIEPPPRPRPVARPEPPRETPRPIPRPKPRRIVESTGPATQPEPADAAPVPSPVPSPPPSARAAAASTPVAERGSAGGPSVPVESGVKDQYLRALIGRIHQKKYYPRQARRRRQEGTVLVAFVIDRSGRLSDVHVARSSGHDSLDRAAIKTLKKISPFRALPPELGVSRWELAVPIAFDLRS